MGNEDDDEFMRMINKMAMTGPGGANPFVPMFELRQMIMGGGFTKDEANDFIKAMFVESLRSSKAEDS